MQLSGKVCPWMSAVQQQGRSILPNQPVPMTLVSCMQGKCQLWWFCGGDIMPLVAKKENVEQKPA